MSILGEAIRAGLQPCSYSLLILAVTVLGVLGDRRRLPALVVYWMAAVLFAWLPFLGIPTLVDGRVAGTVTLLAGLALPGWKATARAGTVGALLVGAFAGATWLPCVGPELGKVLTAATVDARSGLAGLALYLLGVMWIPILLAIVIDYLPVTRGWWENKPVAKAFLALAGVLVIAVATDLYRLVLSHLARISTL